jgi:AraC family transcriptional regulator
MASMLLRGYSTASARAKDLPSRGLTHNNARRVIEYLEANLGRAVTVRELAYVAELSTHHFVRIFQKSLGLTPYQYLLERRVERAKELLQDQTRTWRRLACLRAFVAKAMSLALSIVQSG